MSKIIKWFRYGVTYKGKYGIKFNFSFILKNIGLNMFLVS